MSARISYLAVAISFAMALGGSTTFGQQDAEKVAATPSWAMKATIIEACSCPMFCQCYFDTKPAAHGGHGGHEGEHFCRFNNAFKVDQGRWGDVKLNGAKFWVAGDLGDDFSQGQMNWAVLFFDPQVSKPQRDAIAAILGKLYPVTWQSFTIGPDAAIEWQADNDRAAARADGGKVAEVVLKRYPGMTNQPIVIQNLRYWGAPRNNGFLLMPNEVQALRRAPEGKKPYEFKGTNGFMITFDINSEDAAKTAGE